MRGDSMCLQGLRRIRCRSSVCTVSGCGALVRACAHAHACTSGQNASTPKPRACPRARPGLLLSSQFPVNYFSISDVEQFFPEFAAEYAGFDKALAGTGKFWRFNRIHDYAGKVRRPTLP